MRTRFGRGSLPIRTPGADAAAGRCERSEQMAKSMTTRRKSEAGQSLIFVALLMFVLLAIMGLGIDMGYMRYQKGRLQEAADAGAIAGAGEVLYGTTAVDDAAYGGTAADNFTNGSN